MKSPFVWGQGGRAMTPEEVARQRELVAIAQAKMGDTSPVGHWTQGATRVVDALGGVLRDKRATKAEAAGMAGADAYIQNNPVLAALIGGGGMAPPMVAAGSGSAGAPAVVAPVVAPEQDVGKEFPLGVEALPQAEVVPGGYALGTPVATIPTGYTIPEEVKNGIFAGESGGDYNALFGFANRPGGKYENVKLTDMTVDEALAFANPSGDYGQTVKAQVGRVATPMGAYQIVGTTLRAAKEGLGLTGNEKMTPELQDQLGGWILAEQGTGAWEGYRGPRDSYTPASGGPASFSTASGGSGGVSGGNSASVTAALAAAMSDPWVAKKYGPVLEALMGQEMKRSDMQYQAQLAQSDPMYQAQLAQLTTPQAREPIEVGGVLLDPLTYEPIFDSRTAGGTDAPETQVFFDEATGQEYRAQWNGTEWVRIGGTKAPTGPLVNVDVGAGDSEFEKAFAKGDAETIATVNNAGLAAQRNLGRIDQLESILSSTPTGMGASLAQAAGEWGIPTEGLSEIQAAEALINSLVPEQRQPGSGPMSDADLALFKKSLPRIINQPGGNQVILSTMRAIAQYDAEGAAIVQRMRLPPDDPNYLDRGGAMAALQNRVNPLEAVKAAGGGGDAGAPPTGVPDGVDPAVWNVMTPEEKALFQ